ncbi:hypothetical protein L2E82_28085 [Cichorium intybus]|uniref:Uncharacterized protein n=1 Tax=Cichorium intybus TaxID=13427 RepID=A0ACB9CUT1_CICIN|nr:hypothetical protein L2E82_28085 [Cichorium intybus]
MWVCATTVSREAGNVNGIGDFGIEVVGPVKVEIVLFAGEGGCGRRVSTTGGGRRLHYWNEVSFPPVDNSDERLGVRWFRDGKFVGRVVVDGFLFAGYGGGPVAIINGNGVGGGLMTPES